MIVAMNKNLLIFLIVVIAVAGLFLFLSRGGGDKRDLTSFAQCLAGKNITMYGLKNCPYCRQEKADFGKAFQYVLYIECDAEPQKCLEAKIEAVPAWLWPDGKRLTGYQSLEKLAGESGCVLPQ